MLTYSRFWMVSAFFFLFSFTMAGEGRVHLSLPDGWVDVSEKVSQGDIAGIPKNLVKLSKNSLCRVLAADPKTFKASSPTYMMQIHIPQMDKFDFTDESLKGLAAGLEESVKDHPEVTLVEDGARTVEGVKIFRSQLNTAVAPSAGGRKSELSILQYYLPDGEGATSISFYTPRSNLKARMPVFEGIISKTLK